MNLHVFGTRGSFPVFGKAFEIYGQATSCYVIKEDDYAIVLDCGSGLVAAADYLFGCKKIDVLLSHVHYDHIMGLFQNPEVCEGAEVCFYGNFSEWIVAEAENSSTIFRIEELTSCGDTIDIQPQRKYLLDKGYMVSFRKSNHGDGTCMIEINKDQKRLCYTGDYEHYEGSDIVDYVRGCDLLLFDGSYNELEYPKYKGWGHSAWEDGARIALAADVKRLLITHHAPGKDDRYLEEEEKKLRQMNEKASFAKEGMIYSL